MKKGDRMVMTPFGYDRLVRQARRSSARVTIGTYVKPDGPLAHWILRDGHKRAESYHRDFWERAR